MSFYSSLRSVASALISAKGRNVVLRSRSATSYDPTTSTSGGSLTDTSLMAVVSNYPVRNIDGTRVQQGDLKVMMVSSIAPKVGDGLLIDGVEHDVLGVRELNPGGIVLTYTVQVRQGG